MYNKQVYAEVLAIYGERYRFVYNRWWVYEDGFWLRTLARERLFMATYHIWGDMFPERVAHTYLINQVVSALAQELWDMGLPGRVTPDLHRRQSSGPPTPPPDPEPAP